MIFSLFRRTAKIASMLGLVLLFFPMNKTFASSKRRLWEKTGHLNASIPLLPSLQRTQSPTYSRATTQKIFFAQRGKRKYSKPSFSFFSSRNIRGKSSASLYALAHSKRKCQQGKKKLKNYFLAFFSGIVAGSATINCYPKSNIQADGVCIYGPKSNVLNLK